MTAEADKDYSNFKTTVPQNLGVDVHPRNFDSKERNHRFKPQSYDPNHPVTDYY
jgi:hypothetical protein